MVSAFVGGFSPVAQAGAPWMTRISAGGCRVGQTGMDAALLVSMKHSNTIFRLLLGFVLAVLCMAPLSASAQDSGFGLGVVFGDPTGVAFKAYVGPTTAIDGAVGLGVLGGDHVAAYIDFLWESRLTSWSGANLAWYIGIGPKVGRFSHHSHHGKHDDHSDHDQLNVGARAPLGLTFQLTRVPVDIFVEAAAGLWIVDNARFDLDGGLGARFWF